MTRVVRKHTRTGHYSRIADFGTLIRLFCSMTDRYAMPLCCASVRSTHGSAGIS